MGLQPLLESRTDGRLRESKQGLEALAHLHRKSADSDSYLAEELAAGTLFVQLVHNVTSAVIEVGADRIMFSTDWPFENIDHAADWFDEVAISEADRVKIGRTNAMALFGLDLS